MQIEAVSKSSDTSLSGKREVWFRVFSSEVLDWPSIQAKLSQEQADMLATLGVSKQLAYFPHTVTAAEREDHGYDYDEFWVWSAR